MGGGRSALKCSCDATTKKALNVAFKLCNSDHQIHDRCAARNKSTRVTADVLNRFIMSILNTSGVTTTLPKFVEDNTYPVCQTILTKIDKVLDNNTSSSSTHNNNDTNPNTNTTSTTGGTNSSTYDGITSTSTIPDGGLTDPGTSIIAA